MSKELAKEKGIKNGDTVMVNSGRGEMQAVAMVTSRFKPFKVADQTVHQVGMPWCFGWQYPEDGSGGQREPAYPDRRRREHHDPRIQGLHGQRREGIGGSHGDE